MPGKIVGIARVGATAGVGGTADLNLAAARGCFSYPESLVRRYLGALLGFTVLGEDAEPPQVRSGRRLAASGYCVGLLDRWPVPGQPATTR